jgi:hypothetical protein
MPTMPRLIRRRQILAGFLLVVAVLVAALVLIAPGNLDAARAKYDRIEVGMSEEEVAALLHGWDCWVQGWDSKSGSIETWIDPWTGATITVNYDIRGQHVKRKHLDEGDQSFQAQVERVKDRLTHKLHLGP